MKPLYAFLALTLATPHLLAQGVTFELNGKNTHHILQSLDKSPELYHVTRAMIKTAIVDKKRQKTKEYVAIQKKIKLLKNRLNNNLSNQNPLVEETCSSIPEIIKNLNAYVKSSLPYRDTKHYLSKAQELMDLNGFSYLVYADQNIQAGEMTAFSDLKSDPKNLTTYVKSVIWDLEEHYPDIVWDEKDRAKNSDPSTLKNQITLLEKKLRTTPKYQMVTNGQKSYTKMSYMLQAIVKDPAVLYGVFQEEKGTYYVMGYDYNKFKRGELLTADTMEKYAILPKQMTFSTAKKLIRNIANNEYYLVPENFKTLFEYQKPETASIVKNGNSLKRVSNNSLKNSIAAKEKPTVSYTYKSRIITNEELEAKNAIASYEKVIENSKALTQKLQAHYQALIDGKMSTTRVKEWKKDINEAERLYQKIAAMTGNPSNPQTKQSGNPEFLENYADFSKALSSTKRISGY